MEKKQIFKSTAQFLETIHVSRKAKIEGAEAIGLFGSRSRGDNSDDSDADVMIIKKGASNLGHYDFRNNDVHVVTIPPEVEGDSKNSEALRNMKSETRWFWKKKKN